MIGAPQMVARLKTLARRFPDHVIAALRQEAEIEVTEMKKRTPVDTTPKAPHPGNLRASIHVADEDRSGRMLSVTVATGKQAPYAIYVHENPDAFHPVGQWKFMESVIQESRPHMARRLARRVDLNKMKVR